jgi:serine protease Do
VISVADAADAVIAVVRSVLPAVVNVTAEAGEDLGGAERRGVGTGFIVRADGIVVTNYHVVEQAQRITVTTSGDDPERYEARVIGGDPQADLAVLQIDATGLPTVRLGTSDDLELGQQVVAIGYALALEGGPTVTTGVVSARDRTITVADANCAACENGERTYTDVVQTDAAINPGNSGGPLVDLSGRVIGINTAGSTRAENIGFAIAIDAALPTIRDAEENPAGPVAYLGVSTVDVTPPLVIQQGLTVEAGVFVVAVAPGSAAERAGIRAGDVIVAFGGTAVVAGRDLGDLVRDREPGDRVEIDVVLRDGARRTFTATLGVNPLPTG